MSMPTGRPIATNTTPTTLLFGPRRSRCGRSPTRSSRSAKTVARSVPRMETRLPEKRPSDKRLPAWADIESSFYSQNNRMFSWHNICMLN